MRPLDAEQLHQFHVDPTARLPHRRYVVTAEDGFAEAVRELTLHGRHRPQLFAVTGAAGFIADWFGGVQLADWTELRALRRAGGSIGSHAQHDLHLTDLPDRALDDKLVGSLGDLRAQVPMAIPMLAYPHGGHDERVRSAAIVGRIRTGVHNATRPQRRWNVPLVSPSRRTEDLGYDNVVHVEGRRRAVTPGWWERRLQQRWRPHRPSAV